MEKLIVSAACSTYRRTRKWCMIAQAFSESTRGLSSVNARLRQPGARIGRMRLRQLTFKTFWHLILGLLLVADLLSENPSGVKGKVVDQSEHAPIRNAYILAHRNGATDKTLRTDESGRYSVELPPDIYDIFIAADGFAPACRKVKVEPDGMMVFDATLDASLIGTEE